eukprot:scaffold71_cov247-Pinguiococcus_pyrenoidosus.AAC.16
MERTSLAIAGAGAQKPGSQPAPQNTCMDAAAPMMAGRRALAKLTLAVLTEFSDGVTSHFWSACAGLSGALSAPEDCTSQRTQAAVMKLRRIHMLPFEC